MIKKIHQIYISENNTLPSEFIQQQMAKVKQLYSDWEYNLYNNDQCREVIHSLFGKKVVDLYDTLNAFSFRADFARYCILYKYGGQYFDASICPEFRLEFDDTAIVYEPPFEWANCRLIDNGVMIFNKTEHALLSKAIQTCVKNIQDKNYGDGSLDITGPMVLGKLQKFDDVTYGHSKFITPTQKAAFLGDVLHWLYKPEGTNLEKFGCTGVNNYDNMWLEKRVFRSEPTAMPKITNSNVNRITTQHEKQIYSQNGEDGIIEHIFNHITPANKKFVEIGVSAGSVDQAQTNTMNLANKGWSGYWFDCVDMPHVAPNCTFVKKTLTADNVAETFKFLQIPHDIDIISIDIDSNDYYILQALCDYRPILYILEYNGCFDGSTEHIMPRNDDYTWAGQSDRNYGTSLKSITKYANNLGYDLVYCESMGINAFFIRKDVNVFQPLTSEEAWVKLHWA